MVYLLHGYFGRDGREEAEALLQRRSGNPDKPRILGAFNEPIANWLDFFMFTTFTDRDGKYQLLALAESGFDPLSRTTRFMLTEEAHHMFVGETGVGRVVERACQLMRKSEDVRKQGGIDLPTIQKYLNFWFSVSVDLFGGEKSSNAADYFASGPFMNSDNLFITFLLISSSLTLILFKLAISERIFSIILGKAL